MWTLDYEADIASDLSAFHRIDDPMTIDGPRYFSLAARLGAYAGVMAARMEKIRQDERDGVSAAHGGSAAAPSPERPSRVEDSTAIAMLAAEGWAEHVTVDDESGT